MKCLQCDNTAKVGQSLCPQCLLASAKTSGDPNREPTTPKSLFEIKSDASTSETSLCVKCNKPAEPTKILCAECLGKHQPFSKQERQGKDRKKRSRLAQAIDLLLGQILTAQDAVYIERRSNLLIGALGRLLFLGAILAVLVFAYQTWREQSKSAAGHETVGISPSESRHGPALVARPSRSQPPGVDNPALRITITEPAKGSLFKVNEALTIGANPEHGSALPAMVKFSVRGKTICEVRKAPFVCVWGQLPLGTHFIQAQGFTNAGEGGPPVSTAIKVVAPATFERIKPASRELPIFIASPSEDTHVILDSLSASTELHFKGWVPDAIKAEKMSARIDAQSCRIQGSKEFSGSCFIASPGRYTLTVEVIRSDGSLASSDVSFTADRNPGESWAGQVNPYYSNETLYDMVQDWGGTNPMWELNDPAGANIAPEEERDRIAPTFYEAPISPEVARFSGMSRLSDASTAGSFDDYFATLYANNPAPALSWSAPSGNMVIPVQPRLFGFSGKPPLPLPLNRTSTYGVPRFASRGISFVSFYDETGGHATFMDTSDKNVPMERDAYFLSTLATTAAGGAYTDTLPDQISDSFDGLFTHYLVVAGEKGKESAAVTKLMAAGSFLPYETKRILKMTGNYAVILQWLWRAGLPYSDGEGNPLAMSHEARHRVVYVACGDDNLSTLSANQSYHRYNEALHMREMVRLAGKLKGTLPPITILSLVDYSVTKGDATVVSSSTWDNERQRIKLMLPTVARVWGEAGESIHLRIDLGRSYDIFGKPLTYKVEPLYPEHRPLVSISQEGVSRFLVSVRDGAEFPQSRIPVIATASNGTFEGTPVFINFLWPGEALRSVAVPKPFDAQIPETHVNRNKRPIVSSQAPLNLVARVGATVRIPLSCSDPEGFDTSWIRWYKEPGKIENSTYIFPVTSEYAGRTLTLHFICSDGTGGYGSIERTLHVE